MPSRSAISLSQRPCKTSARVCRCRGDSRARTGSSSAPSCGDGGADNTGYAGSEMLLSFGPSGGDRPRFGQELEGPTSSLPLPPTCFRCVTASWRGLGVKCDRGIRRNERSIVRRHSASSVIPPNLILSRGELARAPFFLVLPKSRWCCRDRVMRAGRQTVVAAAVVVGLVAVVGDLAGAAVDDAVAAPRGAGLDRHVRRTPGAAPRKHERDSDDRQHIPHVRASHGPGGRPVAEARRRPSQSP
jgi:hypothetical protein